jgi:hypothetical protein
VAAPSNERVLPLRLNKLLVFSMMLKIAVVSLNDNTPTDIVLSGGNLEAKEWGYYLQALDNISAVFLVGNLSAIDARVLPLRLNKLLVFSMMLKIAVVSLATRV